MAGPKVSNQLPYPLIMQHHRLYPQRPPLITHLQLRRLPLSERAELVLRRMRALRQRGGRTLFRRLTRNDYQARGCRLRRRIADQLCRVPARTSRDTTPDQDQQQQRSGARAPPLAPQPAQSSQQLSHSIARPAPLPSQLILQPPASPPQQPSYSPSPLEPPIEPTAPPPRPPIPAPPT